MSGSPPFVDRDSGELELRQIWEEAIPILGLIVLFGSLALLPRLLVMMVFEGTFLTLFLVLFTQLVLAVGAGVVLMYIIARAMQLAEN